MTHENSTSTTARKRCIVYIDAFNWYFGIFQHRPEWKWLNIQSFFETLRPNEDIVLVKFFTALVDPKKHLSLARDRQKRYLNALTTLPKVKVIYGRYQDRKVTCRAQCRQEYDVPEEKKTDVNIAVNLIDDALKNQPDSMVLVSGDSDLEPAIQWLRKNYPQIKLTVYIPALEEEAKNRRNDFYLSIGVLCRFLPLADVEKHQLPRKVVLANGSIVMRPTEWA